MSKSVKSKLPKGEHADSNVKRLPTRKIHWYNVKDVIQETECPSCGRPMERFKMPLAHVKRCFAIKKIGPVYRLHGYEECKCGLLIANNSKAKKLHVCVGEVPAFEPDLSLLMKRPLSPPTEIDANPVITYLAPVRALERELLQPKPWIRNFVSPLKFETVKAKLYAKPEPRVRNFDMPLGARQPHDVWIYSISGSEGLLSEPMELPLQSPDENVVLLRKKMLSLPKLKSDRY